MKQQDFTSLVRATHPDATLTKQQQRALTQRALALAGVETPVRRARTPLRRAVLIAACALLCTATVLAATGTLQEIWKPMLRTGRDVPGLAQAGVVIGQTVTQNGVSITLESAVCDGTDLTLLLRTEYETKAEKGPYAEVMFDTGTVTLDDGTDSNAAPRVFGGTAWQSFYLPRAEGEIALFYAASRARTLGIRSQQYLLCLPLNGSAATKGTLRIDSVTVWRYPEVLGVPSAWQNETVKGTWEFDFSFQRAALTGTVEHPGTLQYDSLLLMQRTFTQNEEVPFLQDPSAVSLNYDNAVIAIDKLEITPLFLRLWGSAQTPVPQTDQDALLYALLPCRVTLRSGASQEYTAPLFFTPEGVQLTIPFETLYQPEDVASVTVFSPGYSVEHTFALP